MVSSKFGLTYDGDFALELRISLLEETIDAIGVADDRSSHPISMMTIGSLAKFHSRVKHPHER
jgi:hypothetical protein